jgi:hypothetical protein
VDVSGPIVLPARNICAINVFLKMHLLVVKTVVLCYVAKIPFCHRECDTCDVPYCLDCFEGHAARICDSCKAPTKCQDCVNVLDECPRCGDRPLEYDGTC